MKEVGQKKLPFWDSVFYGILDFFGGFGFMGKRLVVTCMVDAIIAAIVYFSWYYILIHYGIKFPLRYVDVWLGIYTADLVASCLR
jgi:hypothetical protein